MTFSMRKKDGVPALRYTEQCHTERRTEDTLDSAWSPSVHEMAAVMNLWAAH